MLLTESVVEDAVRLTKTTSRKKISALLPIHRSYVRPAPDCVAQFPESFEGLLEFDMKDVRRLDASEAD